MKNQIFTKQEVIFLINELLEMPDILIDAVENENTDYNASDLLNIAVTDNQEKLKNGESIFNDLVLIASVDAKTKEGRFCNNIAKMSIKNLK